jgi:putative AdoMet-dependent methyltransferase
MLNSNGFDLWANEYDKSVNLNEERNGYPFAGYKDVLNYIYQQIREKPVAKVLDIGFGTGVLTTQLYHSGCEITGIDFSDKMIAIAKQKMPLAKLIKWDISDGLPNEVKTMKFDFIISTYALHHITDQEKVEFIKSLCPLLNENGKILIGDVSFETRNDLDLSKLKYADDWDHDEIYFVADEIDEIKESLKNHFFCDYIKLSHCAGVLSIEDKRL